MNKVDFNSYLGLKTQLSRPGKTVIVVTLEPRLLNRAGYLHGGAMMTLMDTLMGHAAYSLLQAGERIATSSMTTHFLEAVSGGEIAGTGEVVAENDRFVLTEAQLHDGDNRLIATARGQFSRLRK